MEKFEALKIALEALEKIAKDGGKEDPELDPTCSQGNGDDQFYDGDTQGRWHCAAHAREALEKIGNADALLEQLAKGE